MNNIISRKLSILALVISILAILSSPIILVILFGISWALADSGLPPGLSDYMLLYSINSILYILGFTAIALAITTIIKSRNLKRGKAMSITPIVLGAVSAIIGVVFTLLIMNYFT
jgi:hypothetical protein